jgi:protein ImuB
VASPPGALAAIARACSPSVALTGDRTAVFDASGLERALGPPEVIAREVRRLAADRGLSVRVAIAATATAAALLAHARAEKINDVGGRFLACLFPENDPRRLDVDAALDTFHRWGLRTCGDIARLPRAEVAARLGALGVALHQAACGVDVSPLVPLRDARPFVERVALEWPIEGLEPLSFVLARICETLETALERADRGAVDITTRLTLVTRDTHTRVLHLPSPMREARVLRTLVLLDLESHPPPAAIDAVEVALGVVPGRIAQGSLLARTLPSPETLATLLARLGALMGDSRVGAPSLVDTHDARAVAMKPFAVLDSARSSFDKLRTTLSNVEGSRGGTCLRRFRFPLAAHVATDRGAPVRVAPAAHGLPPGLVVDRAGPWRTSGRWWALDRSGWDRDEWDVELAHGGCLRVGRDRATGQWEIAGVFD